MLAVLTCQQELEHDHFKCCTTQHTDVPIRRALASSLLFSLFLLPPRRACCWPCCSCVPGCAPCWPCMTATQAFHSKRLMGACSRSKTFEPTGRVTAELSCAFRTQGHCLLTNIGNLKQSSFVWCTCWLLALFHITNLQILSESVHGTINHHSALIRPSCIAMDQCANSTSSSGTRTCSAT